MTLITQSTSKWVVKQMISERVECHILHCLLLSVKEMAYTQADWLTGFKMHFYHDSSSVLPVLFCYFSCASALFPSIQIGSINRLCDAGVNVGMDGCCN